MAKMITTEGRRRVVIEGIKPQVADGQFPIKRVVGEPVNVSANIFCDGNDVLCASLKYRPESDDQWQEIAMEPLFNDGWRATFAVALVGTYYYTVEAWVDAFLTWHRDFQKRVAAGKVAEVDLLVGAQLVEAAVPEADKEDGPRLREWARRLRGKETPSQLEQICEDPELTQLMQRYAPRTFATQYAPELPITVDRERARFSSWYELFPRSCASEPGAHGTLRDVEARLGYVAEMGFNVLYLPPIHPIGQTFRKGKDNATEAEADDVGSPWGIGSKEGGHKAIHPSLGTLADFDRLVQAAEQRNIEIALDIALQCSPDHPYVKDHPDWFRQRPDGTIQYAENPPKKYQDIYPFDFETADWQALWAELKSIFDFWIERGVRIFRVDNPHTKPFPFWEWCIGEIRRKHADVLFLAEAFTRPKIMYRLAKLGFSQSYTYFSWRNSKEELTEYLTELTRTEVREYFRPNFWPNTPDILTEYLQVGGRPAFMSRLVLAATLSSNYGIYGPPYEHGWCKPREPGSEEYLGSEKYEVHHHDMDRQDSLRHFVARVNRLRRDFLSLQTLAGLQFHEVDNQELICYSKSSADLSELLLVVVNLDPHHTQSGWVELPLKALELDENRPFQVHDLLSDMRYLWHGPRNLVELDPQFVPAHVFQIKRRVRSERDFEYFL
jgi:starch synthase (maltosyl-transferring)